MKNFSVYSQEQSTIQIILVSTKIEIRKLASFDLAIIIIDNISK